jgi:hypothetical protein
MVSVSVSRKGSQERPVLSIIDSDIEVHIKLPDATVPTSEANQRH